jgi:hypothetical protein
MIALRVIGEAIIGDVKQLVAAGKEIADRTEGKAVQRKEVEVTVNLETKREISTTAYCLLYESKSRELAQQELD